jgi:hypothetical protein
MANWQEQLQDIYIARAFDLEKVKNASAKQISRTLDDLIREIVREVESADIMGVKRTAYQQERMNKLFNMADKTIKSQFKLIAGSVTGELLTLAEIESMFAAKAINSVLQVNIVDYALSREVLESLSKDTLIQGAPSSQWWSKQASSLQDEFKRVMRVSVARGETLGQMTARIKGTQDITKLGVKGKVPGVTDEMLRAALGEPGLAKKANRNAKALVKSSYQAVMADARMEVYKNNDDVIKGVEFFATLDNRTTLICRAYDGSKYDNNGNPIMGTRLPFKSPPSNTHWGCRSILVPIMRGLDEILGIPGIPPIPPSTRSAFSETGMRGQVSGTTNFDGFMKSLSREEGSKVIGKKRYDLWNSGKLSLQDMLNSDGNVMSLKALQEKTEKGLFWAD